MDPTEAYVELFQEPGFRTLRRTARRRAGSRIAHLSLCGGPLRLIPMFRNKA